MLVLILKDPMASASIFEWKKIWLFFGLQIFFLCKQRYGIRAIKIPSVHVSSCTLFYPSMGDKPSSPFLLRNWVRYQFAILSSKLRFMDCDPYTSTN